MTSTTGRYPLVPPRAVPPDTAATESAKVHYQGRQPYQDPAYTGQFDLYTECGGVGASYVVIAVVPPDRSYVIRVQVQANSDRDFDVLDRVIDTFVVTGQV